MPAEPARRFRIGEVPPLTDGFTDRPDTVGGLADVLVPGSAVALVPDPAVAQTLPNWPGACGKTQMAVMIAESLWRSRAIDGLIWISATSRAAVMSGFVQASVAATGLEPTGTANSVAVRFVSWLGETRLPWLVVLDDLPESVDLTGLWPAGLAGRLLITSSRPAPAVGPPGTRVIPVGFFSTREALNGLSERLSVNPVQRQGAIDLAEALGREPLALGQASAVVASSNLTCRDYRDLFLQRRDEIWTGPDEIPSAAMVTWILCLERAESLLPSSAVRLMLVFLALLDGHGVPGTVFGTQALIGYLGGSVTPFPAAADPRQVWDVLLALERAGLIGINRDVAPPTVLMSSALQEAIKLAAPADFKEPAARAAAECPARGVARRRAVAMGGGQPAGERGQPAGLGHRRAVGGRVSSAAAAGGPEPRRSPPSRAGRRVLAGSRRALRCQAAGRSPRCPRGGRPSGRRVPDRRERRRGRPVVPAGPGRPDP